MVSTLKRPEGIGLRWSDDRGRASVPAALRTSRPRGPIDSPNYSYVGHVLVPSLQPDDVVSATILPVGFNICWRTVGQVSEEPGRFEIVSLNGGPAEPCRCRR